MAKIKPVLMAATGDNVFIVDDKGKFWIFKDSAWAQLGELPEAPAVVTGPDPKFQDIS